MNDPESDGQVLVLVVFTLAMLIAATVILVAP